MPVNLPPSISIVVPTYKRVDSLTRLLHSLTRLKYPTTRFEVMLVDDGGGPSFGVIPERFEPALRLECLNQSNSGPGSARNVGAEGSEGEILAFTDDDCEVDSLWLEELSKGFETGTEPLCGGRTVNSLPHNPYASASQLLVDFLYEHYNPERQWGAFFPTNNVALPRTRFLALEALILLSDLVKTASFAIVGPWPGAGFVPSPGRWSTIIRPWISVLSSTAIGVMAREPVIIAGKPAPMVPGRAV